MKTIFSFIFVIAIAQITAAQPLQVKASLDVPRDQIEILKIEGALAIELFEQQLFSIEKDIHVYVGSEAKALRTGYDPAADTVNFPALQSVLNYGIQSKDVIHHELFHAMLCRSVPFVCQGELLTKPEFVRIHEALADYFSYILVPDLYFGEDFYIGVPYMRIYQNSLAISLVDGPHAQGNALTRHLIKNNISLSQIKKFLQDKKFSLNHLKTISPQLQADIEQDLAFKVDKTFENYPASDQLRFRISPDKPLIINLIPNPELLAAHPSIHFTWSQEKGENTLFKIESTATNSFSVSVLPNAKSEKVILNIYSSQNLIGQQSFYFGPKLPN